MPLEVLTSIRKVQKLTEIQEIPYACREINIFKQNPKKPYQQEARQLHIGKKN